jgi:hypothetical protein
MKFGATDAKSSRLLKDQFTNQFSVFLRFTITSGENRVYFMSNSKKFALVTALSSLMFGTVAATAIASASPADATTSAATLAQTSQQEKPTAQVVEDNDFKFQLQSCQRAGKKVTCSLLITNLANRDRPLRLNNNSRSFDFSGNEYFAYRAQIGKDRGTGTRTKLLTGIPIKASVSFELPQSATQLAAIEIAYNSYYDYLHHDGTVKFRDVDIISSK